MPDKDNKSCDEDQCTCSEPVDPVTPQKPCCQGQSSPQKSCCQGQDAPNKCCSDDKD